jgi:predicted nuclease of predicted toxin-antitoxin system
MLLLADESFHAEVVAWLRARGHDVLYAAETQRQVADPELLAIARADGRAILTEDLDSGELVYRQGLASHGVVLVRLPGASGSACVARLGQVWATIESNLPHRFIVVTADRLRMRSLPGGPPGGS